MGSSPKQFSMLCTRPRAVGRPKRHYLTNQIIVLNQSILLIDDDLVEHRIFRKLLENGPSSKADLTCCSNIECAIERLKENTFEYIFLDDRLSPYSNLLDTLPLIRGYLGRAKIIAMSSSLDSPHLMSAENIGVDKVLDKNDLRAFLSSPLP